MRYANFPGCSATTTGRSYSESFAYVAAKTGIDLVTVPDWNCCGAGHAPNAYVEDALPARSLALSEAAFGDTPVVALCAACYGHLKGATAHARASKERLSQMVELIDRPWSATAEVVNGIEPFLDEEVRQKLSAAVTHPLNGLKVACYYGCLLVRPREVTTFDDEENPTSMEGVLELVGCQPVDWAHKTMCCGASHHVARPDAAKPLSEEILANAQANGAEAIACACPLCWLNLDMREAEVNKQRLACGQAPLDLPVYFFTELLARALGASDAEAGLTHHFHEAASTVQRAIDTPQPTSEERAAREKAERIAKAKAAKAAREAAATGGAVSQKEVDA